jgi:hypothetical protein
MRIIAIQEVSKMSIDEIGKKLGLSGSFLGNLMRKYVYKGRQTAVRTKHVNRIKAALLQLEATYGLRSVPANDKPASDKGHTISQATDSLDMHVRGIHDRGFAVTLTPLAASPR